MVYVVHPNTANLSLEEVGIKAAALGHMEKIGLPVPPFRVLSAGFFEHHANEIGLPEKLAFLKEEIKDNREIGKHLSKIISDSRLSETLLQELAQAVEQIRNNSIERLDQQMSFSVRISKSYLSSQDSKIRLHLQGIKEIESAVISAYADHFSETGIDERVSKGIDALSLKIPLVLQQFVKPDVTGIIMSMGKDNPDHYYIVAWKGFGFEMNFHFCDHYVVNHKDLMLKRFLNNKTGEVVFFDESKNSITRTKILHSEASVPFLNHNEIVGLCEIYSNHKDNLGGLGIEFKVRKNKVVMISLKDESVLGKASAALEDLKELASKTQSEESTSLLGNLEGETIETDSVSEPAEEIRSEPYSVESFPVDSEENVESVSEENTSDEPVREDVIFDTTPQQHPIFSHEQEETTEIKHTESEHHKSLSEEVTESVMGHHITFEGSSDDALLVDDNDNTTDNMKDLIAHIDSVCEKYIAINPNLERVIRMLQNDIKSSISMKELR